MLQTSDADENLRPRYLCYYFQVESTTIVLCSST